MISLIVDNVRYVGWSRVTIQRTLFALSSAFEVTLADIPDNTNWFFAAQKSVQIFVNESKVLTGFIDSVSISVDSTTHTVVLRGRDKTADLIDSSAVSDKKGKPYTKVFSGVDLSVIARELVAPFDIKVKTAGSVGAKFPRFSPQRGETVFEALDRAAKQRGIVLLTDVDGTLVLSTTGATRAKDSLVYGINVQSAEGVYNYSNRFRHYRVESSVTSGGEAGLWGKGSSAPVGMQEDKAVLRVARMLQIMSEGDADKSSCRKRAALEALYRAATSETFDLGIVGWEQTTKDIWQLNLLVSVDIPPLYVKGDLLISGVVYSYDDEGTKTTLSLTRKDSFDVARTIDAESLKDTKEVKRLWSR